VFRAPLSFNKTVVTRYRIHLESRQLAPGTINVRLAAVRRLAYEAADSGLPSPDLAAGIHRVKGAQKIGRPAGKLADGGGSSLSLASAWNRHAEREARSSPPGRPTGLRPSRMTERVV